jgi:hypothetical protein
MIRPARFADGSTHPYGFGIGMGEVRGRPAIGHGGGIFGFNTDSIYVPSEDLFVAVFANSDDPATPPGLIMQRMAALALGQPYREFTAVPIDMRAVDPMLGVYRMGESGPTRRFFAREGKLYTMRDDGPEQEVFAAGNNLFFYGPRSLTWFQMERQADGSYAMQMHQQGAEAAERSVRTGPVPPEAPPVVVPPAVLQTYVGSYTTPGPQVTIALGADGRLTIQLTGQPAIPMRATSQNEFVVDRVGARVVFNSEGGRVVGLIIHQGGRQLPGTRAAR